MKYTGTYDNRSTLYVGEGRSMSFLQVRSNVGYYFYVNMCSYSTIAKQSRSRKLFRSQYYEKFLVLMIKGWTLLI